MATRRAIWSGSISFGLVNIPVRLYTATVSHDIAFHQFQARTGQRIHNKRVAERSGREVPFEDIVKGYEVARGKVVMVDPKELEALEPRRTRTVEIEQFVELKEIDPIAWESTYYLGPEPSQGAVKSYHLLRRAMEEEGKVGIGRFVMRTKEYLVTVRPFGRGLALETMYYADEIRDQEEAAGSPGKMNVSPGELRMARQLIQAMSAPFALDEFKDTYRDRVENLLRRKARGEAIVYEEPPAEQGQVVDLREALKASLAAGAPAPRSAARGRERHRGRRGKSGRKSTRAA